MDVEEFLLHARKLEESMEGQVRKVFKINSTRLGYSKCQFRYPIFVIGMAIGIGYWILNIKYCTLDIFIVRLNSTFLYFVLQYFPLAWSRLIYL
jgi:hypothetical protein